MWKEEVEEWHVLDTTAWATGQDYREGFYEEGGGRGVACGLQLEGRVCSMLMVMLWRLGRRDSGLNLGFKSQTAESVKVRVRVEDSSRGHC